MKLLTAGMLALTLAGCQEYQIHGDKSVYGEPNPPDLGAPVRTDRIVQVTVPAVDVLFVIDNSGSMYQEQEALKKSFPQFMNYFIGSGLDWHVGVVSTDMDDPNHRGKLREYAGQRYLTPESPTPVDSFKVMASLGDQGSPDERGRAAAWSALVTLRDSYNSGFYRDNANLAVIVISDEDDHSGSAPVSLDEFISWMLEHKIQPDMTTFSSIVGPPGGCSSDMGEAAYGKQYDQVTKAVGGIFWSICSSDWDQVLDELGMLAAGLKREFFLSEVPVEDTIDVWVVEGGETHEFYAEHDWVYSRSRNSITFNTFVPDELSEVYIEYELLAAWHPEDETATGDTGDAE